MLEVRSRIIGTLISVALVLLLCLPVRAEVNSSLAQDSVYQLSVVTDKPDYIRGNDSSVLVSGTLLKNESRVTDVFIGLVLMKDGSNPVMFNQQQTDEDGNIKWNISLDALDDGAYSIIATANQVSTVTEQFSITQPGGGPDQYSITVGTDKTSYVLGEEVKVSGSVFKNGETYLQNITVGLVLSKGGTPVYFGQVVTNNAGKYEWVIPEANLESGDYAILATANVARGKAVFKMEDGGSTDPDLTPPEVVSTEPADGEVGVAVSKSIIITFNEDIDAGSANNAVTLKDSSSTLVAFNQSVNGQVLTIKPNGNLNYGEVYTVSIPPNAVQDTAGNELLDAYTFSFTTASKGGGGGGGGGGTALAVNLLTPLNNTGSVDLNTPVSAAFNKVIQAVNLGQVYIADSNGNREVGVTAAINGKVLEISHNQFKPGTTYTVYIPVGTVEAMLNGEDNKAINWSFTTAGAVELPGGCSFTDVDTTHWAQALITELCQKGVIAGYPDRTFKPESSVTRAEFAKIIMNAKGLSVSKPVQGIFADVAPGHWFFGYVEAAAGAGLVKGEGGVFRPGDMITREEIAAVLMRAMGKENSVQMSAGAKTEFMDDLEIAPWARGYVAASAAEGLIHGYPDNTFKGAGHTTRAEACALISRAMAKF